MNNNLVLPVYFGFIVLFADAYSIIKLFDHSVGFSIEVGYVGVLYGYSSGVSFGYTIYDGV